MAGPIICFGEILWDVLPHGRFLGGAPLNVAYHLRRLGNPVRLVSAVGRDALGDDACERVKAAGLETDGIARVAAPTGTVDVTLDAAGQASYQIRESVAWDAIVTQPRADEPPPAALVFGSLALREKNNRDCLSSWLAARPSVRLCDLNLRPPFDDVRELDPWVRGSTILKVNEEEARRLSPAGLATTGPEDHAAYLAKHYNCPTVCVTLGAAGALVWSGGEIVRVPSPSVEVRDTIGAGDAFTAALLDGVLRGGPQAWEKRLRRACALGAFVASRDGAQPAYEPSKVPGLA